MYKEFDILWVIGNRDAAMVRPSGATQAFPEAIETSLVLGANALNMVGVPVDDVEQLLQGVRKENYKLVLPVDERTS